MAREDVNIRVSSNVAEAIRLWQAMEEGPRAMGNSLSVLGSKGRKANTDLLSGLEQVVGRWLSIGSAISASIKLVKLWGDAHDAAHRKAVDATTGVDTGLRELFSLADGRRAMGSIRQSVFDTAVQRRVTPDTAIEASSALLGAGYSAKETFEGGATDTALRILAANAATGENVDTKQLIDALTGFLDATQQAKTSDNLLKAGVAMQNLWAATKLSIEDIPAMSPRAAAISSATGMGNEMLAVLSQFRDVTDPSTGATAFRGGVLKLQGAGNVKRREELLAELGLRPEDVDFQGESFFDVQKTLTKAFKEAGPDASRIASGIFGEESMLFYSTLLNDRAVAETQKRLGMQGDVGSFERSREVMEGSYAAKSAEAQARQTGAFYDDATIDPATLRTNLETMMKEKQGYGAFRRGVALSMYDASTWASGDTGEETLRRWAAVAHKPGMYDEVINRSRTTPPDVAPGDPQRVQVDVRLIDQNGLRLPARTEVNDVGKNAAGRR